MSMYRKNIHKLSTRHEASIPERYIKRGVDVSRLDLERRAVLIVEDEDSIRDSLAELFDVAGVSVTTAADTLAALTALRSAEFDLVVTDLRLAGKHDGGLQVMAAAALLSPDAAVIALTAYPQERNRLAASRLGAAHFLEKPVDLLDIAAIAARHRVHSALAPRSTEVGPAE